MAKTDSDIQRDVLRELSWDPRVEETEVGVEVERIQSTVSNGWVTLEGNVDTWTEREDAECAVQNLVGVLGVTDKMTVTSAKPVQTEKVREAIENALERRAEREAKRIQVEVTQAGTVSLTGQVRSWAEKRATLAAARFAPGVRSVEDHLEINPWR